MLAVKNKDNYNAVRRLLDHDADISHRDTTGGTVLHGFFNETVRTLIELYQEDIEIDSRDGRGMSIVHWVCRSRSSLPIDLQRCYKTEPALLEARDDYGRTPLHYACQRGNIAIIEALLLETSQTSSCADWEGRTLMHYATESGRSAQVIDILVREGHEIHVSDNYGRTILHHVAAHGNVAAAEKLLDLGAGADLNILDKDNRTPVQLAAWCGKFDIFHVLRGHCTNEYEIGLPDEQILKVSACQPHALRTGFKVSYLVHVRTFLEIVGAYVLIWAVLQFLNGSKIVV
jgi:ankyrin repeat protein